jgi:uroporphyrinogen III methyltransferase/synthase
VRLKGGDPFVFGRGGEEALALRRAGVPFEIVPGVTAGVAASAYAGIPVTHRGMAGAVAFVTGHTREDGETIDWRSLARFPGTLVLYMGVRELPGIVSELIAAGRPAAEPAVIVEAGTRPEQRVVAGTLGEIAELARREAVRAPAVTVLGPVAGLAGELAWLSPRPLAGLTVAVTRARAQASSLASSLRELGARVVEAPVIRTEPLTGPALDPSGYDLVCLTSANAVEGLFERLRAGGRDARSLAGARIAAIGEATVAALGRHGIEADIVPGRAVAEALADALAEVPASRALIPRAALARDVVPDALRARGIDVDVLPVYETVAEPVAPDTLREALAADYLTFTSSSTVRNLIAAAGGGDSGRLQLAIHTRIASIGPVTSEALREHGLEPDLEAERHDVAGLVSALLADVAGRR